MVKKTISIVVLMLLVIVQSCDKNSKELKIKYADVLEVTVQPTYGQIFFTLIQSLLHLKGMI